MTNKHPCEWYIQMAEMYKKKYDDLVFKIHEKIKGHEERSPHKVDLNFEHYHFEKPEDFPQICFVCLYGQEMAAELKSLLENEK